MENMCKLNGKQVVGKQKWFTGPGVTTENSSHYTNLVLVFLLPKYALNILNMGQGKHSVDHFVVSYFLHNLLSQLIITLLRYFENSMGNRTRSL